MLVSLADIERRNTTSKMLFEPFGLTGLVVVVRTRTAYLRCREKTRIRGTPGTPKKYLEKGRVGAVASAVDLSYALRQGSPS